MDNVNGWQSTFQGVLGDFGRVAASNLFHQQEDLRDKNTISNSRSVVSPDSMPWIIGGALGVIVLLVVVLRR